MTNQQQQRALLSLITKPDNISEYDIAQALDKILPLDLYTLKLQLKAIPPNIIASIPLPLAEKSLELLRFLGCTAFAPTTNQLKQLGPTRKIKEIHLNPQGLNFELWRSNPTTINPENIDVIIKAKITTTTKKKPFSTDRGPLYLSQADTIGPLGAVALDWMNHDEYDDNQSAEWDAPPFSKSSAHGKTSHWKLDIHTTTNTVYQIDGPKFAFNFLGSSKDVSELTNINQTTDFLTNLAPLAIIDTFFDSFNAPPDSQSFRIPGNLLSKDDPTFAFYSRWAALVYRYLAQQY